MSKKILFLFDNLTLGGAERVTCSLMRHLTAEGFHTDALSLGDTVQIGDELPNPPISARLRTPGRRIRQEPLLIAKRCLQLMSGYDYVVPNSPHTLTVVTAAELFGRTSARIIPWAHFPYTPFLESGSFLAPHLLSVRYLYRARKTAVFVSAQSYQDMPALGHKKENWRIIANPFDALDYKKPFVHEAYLKKLRHSGIPVIGTISRFSPEKNLEDLIDCHQVLVSQGVKTHLVLIGAGPTRETLLAKAARSPAREYVHVLAVESNPIRAFELFDIMLMVSEFEAWPTTILESLAAGCPVVAYQSSGPMEMLKGSMAAGLVRHGEIVSLASTVAWGLQNKRSLLADAEGLLTSVSPKEVVREWAQLLQGAPGRNQR